MFSARAGRDVNQLARLRYVYPVPHTLWDDERLARRELDGLFFAGDLDVHLYFPRDQIKEFVAVGVHLTVVGRITGHEWRADSKSLDASRRTLRVFVHIRRPVALQADLRLREPYGFECRGEP